MRQQRLNLTEKRGKFHGLSVVIITARSHRTFAVARHGVGREGDNGNRAGFWCRLDLTGRFPTVENWQAHVHENEIGMLAASQGDTFAAVEGDDCFEAFAIEAAGQHVAIQFVVFHYENFGHQWQQACCNSCTKRRTSRTQVLCGPVTGRKYAVTTENPSERPEQTLKNAELAALRHNLRTPVNHLLGYAELLIEDAAETRNAQALDALRQIHSAARAILNYVNETLSNRDEVDRREIDKLYASVRPRMERITGCVKALREELQLAIPAEWGEDLDRISSGVQLLAEILGRTGAPVGEESPSGSAARGKGGGARLLVVDDNDNNRNLLSRRLQRQGYSVDEARNGSEALDMVALDSYDLVLLDIMMPVMDGFEVLARMKVDRRMRTIPVVVISALDELDSVVRAIEIGAEDYLFKPFNPVLLRARIGALLERKRLADELTVQAKLASLGSLTAGIAHEIKNPLNFVVNFAELAADLVTEQRRLVENAGRSIPENLAHELNEIASDLETNVGKIREHGTRADSIISSMLAHSRGETGERRATDLNALVKEYVRLAFHGMRAQDPTFQADIQEEFDPAAGSLDVIPQDLSRVFLNVAGNGYYALRKKTLQGVAGYRPVLSVRTKGLDDRVEVRIRDNGIGIPKNLRDRIFDPFFTTKAAGEGTGLGLSISYEIVVQEHQGEMRVESEEGEFTEFTIVLPRQQAGSK